MVLQVGGGLDLLDEPLGAEHGGELGAEDLDDGLAIVLEVVREIDCRHPARTESPLDRILLREHGGETGRSVGHPSSLPLASGGCCGTCQ